MSNKKSASGSGYHPRIQSIGRVAAILDSLLKAPSGVLALGDIARACGLVKTTTFTLVDSLVGVGLVDREESGGYRLGLRNLAYGRAVERQLDIASIARTALIRLCSLSNETVNLAVPRPLEAFVVESIEGNGNLRVSSSAGTSMPYHSTACGRALLAFRTREVIEAFYRTAPFKRVTSRTPVTPKALEAVLAETRERGWAIEREENGVGGSCIAAPIFTGGVVQASISIAAPAARLDEARTKQFAEALLREVALVGREVDERRAGSRKTSRVA